MPRFQKAIEGWWAIRDSLEFSDASSVSLMLQSLLQVVLERVLVPIILLQGDLEHSGFLFFLKKSENPYFGRSATSLQDTTYNDEQ